MITSLTTLIEEWAIERWLDTANPDKQMLKLAEEFGELAQGMAKNKPDQIDAARARYRTLHIWSLCGDKEPKRRNG